MADYASMQEAVASGISNMTVIRNNVPNDDGFDNVTSEVDWFYFNKIKVENIYVSGNSYIGFGSNAEHLRVNRRDSKMHYLYKEIGTLANIRFVKIRWEGFSIYSNTSSTVAQKYDVFLLESGEIVLVFDTIPTANFNGANQLVIAGEATIPYSPSVDNKYFTFTPSNPQNGTGWSVASTLPNYAVNYKRSGMVNFILDGYDDISNVFNSVISWDADVPEGTDLRVYSNVNGAFSKCTNGGPVEGISIGSSLKGKTVIIRVLLETTNTMVSPTLKSLTVKIFDEIDKNFLILKTGEGNKNSIQNAIGLVTVTYSGNSLQGEEGLVVPFDKSFDPVGLVEKSDKIMLEHVELSDISASANLMKITYVEPRASKEHVDLSDITAVGTLTHVDDI